MKLEKDFMTDWEIAEALDEARYRYKDLRSRGWRFSRLRNERLNIMCLEKAYREALSGGILGGSNSQRDYK